MRPAPALLASLPFEPEGGWESEIGLVCARWTGAVADAWLAAMGTHDAIGLRVQQRFESLVSFARTHSPYYTELYRDIEESRALLRGQHVRDARVGGDK